LVGIDDLKAQVKLQKLLKDFYTTNTKDEVGWKSRLSRRFSLKERKEKGEKERLSSLLDKFLLDS
jgi:hypothetical protein